LKHENLTDVALALASFKTEVLATNGVVLCLAILGVYLFTRLKKSAELTEINNNFSTVLKQQSDLAEITGKIKNSLDKESIYYQV
jgi:hypothetical protein